MLQYIQYFVAWLFFMGLIAVITLVVPKIAKPIEKWIAEKRANKEAEDSISTLPEEKDTKE